jgi:hypothetical protein
LNSSMITWCSVPRFGDVSFTFPVIYAMFRNH